MRDTKAKTTHLPKADNIGRETCEKKLPYIVGSWRAAENDMIELRSRRFRFRASKNIRAVANQDAMSANGLRTRGSWDR